jgi:guanylate kinase
MLSLDGRATQFYVCGGSGVGKSNLLKSLIRQDIKQSESLNRA